MASGTTVTTLTPGAAYTSISGSETYIAGVVNAGLVELFYGVTGAPGDVPGLQLSTGDDFSFTMGSGDTLYARAAKGGSVTVVRRAT
jgi:hypothetical protein